MKILKIPLNAGGMSKKQGQEKGPDKVASLLEEIYTTEGGARPLFEAIDVLVDNANLSVAHEAIEKAVAALAGSGFSVLLGGDHSMTYPAFKAFAKSNPGAGLIVFDAHPDVQEHQEPPTHEDYLRMLVDERIVDAEKVIILGDRNASPEEKRYLDSKKIKHFSMREIGFEGVREVCDSVMSVARQWPSVYLSLDIDVLDPAFAPGTGYCEPGGLTTRELLYMLQRLKMMRNIRMADVVEVNPEKDINDVTSKVAAKLIVELG